MVAGVLFALLMVVSVHAETTSAAPALPVIPAKSFSISDFRAVGDGKTLNTAALQKAIDAVDAAGGGTLTVPSGRYLTGPLVLTSHLNLHLEKGAVLLMSDDMTVYPVNPQGQLNCITANKAHDLEISGEGTIDGQGAAWWKADRADPTLPRPFLIYLGQCMRVEIVGVTLMNSPMFHLVPFQCDNVTIKNVTITAPANSHNTDGIDPSGSHYLIEGCTIDVGDDNIAIKPGHGQKSEDYLITHCDFRHGHGMAIGSGTRHGGGVAYGLEDVRVSDCTFEETKIGIRIKATRGKGFLARNIAYDHLTMTNVRNPIEFVSYYLTPEKFPTDDPPQPVTELTPVFNHITISNLTVTGSPNAGIIWGLPEMPITDITFDHVQIAAQTGITLCHTHDLRFINTEMKVQSGAKLIQNDAKTTGLN